MSTQSSEDGIRRYLDSLGRQQRPVVDREAVRALKAQIKAETDSLNKLKLLVALQEEEQGRVPDQAGERAVFVAEAKAWADAEGVTAAAFQAMGVPDDVLRDAGFTVSSGPTRPAARTTGGASRAPRIALAEVQSAAARLGEGWKLSDLAAALERDVATARNYLVKLIHEGDVTIVGDDPNHDGRGRAPKVYRTN